MSLDQDSSHTLFRYFEHNIHDEVFLHFEQGIKNNLVWAGTTYSQMIDRQQSISEAFA